MPTNALAPPARNAMLRPYAPSWREQIEAYLMGDSRPSPERRQFAQGLTSILGLVPGVGSVLQAQEAAQSGDRKGVAMAMLPIPGAARAGAVAKAAEREAPHIIAYHGSPHSFDRFDMSKIGTGEGAQAYGHGLYFAESEPVAKSYRDRLGEMRPSIKIKDGGLYRYSDNPQTPEEKAANLVISVSGLNNAKYQELLPMSKALRSAFDSVLLNHEGEEADKVRSVIGGWINSSGHRLNKSPTGSMYQVRINADPEHFLDWDKPLSEQAANEKLKAIDWHARAGNTLGRDRWIRMSDELGEQGATNALREAGIPGIKYLDQGSRGAGEGSRNYVVFDDKLVEIMKKYGLVGPIGAGIAAKILSRQEQRQEF